MARERVVIIGGECQVTHMAAFTNLRFSRERARRERWAEDRLLLGAAEAKSSAAAHDTGFRERRAARARVNEFAFERCHRCVLSRKPFLIRSSPR